MAEAACAPGAAGEILARFAKLPERYAGRELEVTFANPDWREAAAHRCAVLGLKAGATLTTYVAVQPGSGRFVVLTVDDLAQAVLDLPEGATVRARAKTVFGVVREIQYGPAGAVETRTLVKGLLLTELL